jgi:prepilin-type N-terminal cleavage/methylation domain-containing protein
MKKAFTLIELLIVVAIIGILAKKIKLILETNQ